ncbi:Crp/Fnr family transcriptional regulator [Paludibacter sp.]|uniref:Crp/Fnr family transcriptional regulator n=1 Tax=Paludibacter sp. TaxID=1898105 RepID=UPI0013542E30|nr:Crp/Fnr family transcriptional regulator [Paludibacter sp.]MTK53853.1 Crp/Fnr family transcriptional regulator [Paludibacter sp.]
MSPDTFNTSKEILSYKDKIIPMLKNLLETEMKEYIQLISLKKNDFLVREGEVCHYYYFVLEGILRNYYIKDGTEITTNFDFPNDIAANFTSLVLQQKSIGYIQAMTPCKIYRMKASDFDEIKAQNPLMQQIKEILVSGYVILLEERLYSMQFRTAAERYHFMLERYPHFLQQIPLTYIASYLGISLETLSRIRAK